MQFISNKYLFFIILISILVLSSCGSNKKNSDKSVFAYNEASGIISLDPVFSRDQAHIWVCNQLYNSLVKLDDSLNVIPSIAKSWRISDDGLTYIFDLRTDVFFHADSSFGGGSRKVVAKDFVYSFNRLLNPATASPGAWVLSNVAKSEGNYSIYALNDSTLSVGLKQPFPAFLGILSMKYCSVIPHEAVEFYGSNFRRHPVGTGPFKLQNWVENIKLVLRKNPHYFKKYDGEQLPYLDGVAISFLIDKMTAFMEFVKGDFDFISGIDPSYKDELLTKSGELKAKFTNRFTMIEGPFLNTEYLAILVDTAMTSEIDNPLHNLNVRLAINYGFDRKKMIRYLRNGIGTPGTKGIIPKGMPSFNTNADYGYSFNPERSKKLLKEAGFGSHNPVPEITLVTTPDYLDLCKFVQSQLKDVGLSIIIEVSPAATVRELKAHGKLSFFRASWIADYPDEENYLSMFYTNNFAPNGPNYTHFSSSLIDSLYLSTFDINDKTIRTTNYRMIDSLIMEDAPVAVLYYDKVVRFVQKDISGMTINPINMLNLERVRKPVKTQ
ncbi:MAG: ABC transporter substrate-binding protein [Bacteroidota bacterium]